MRIKDCPRYCKCSAPLCPLDKDMKQRTYVKSEPICFYVNQWAKGNTREVPKAIAVEVEASFEKMKKVGGSNLKDKLPKDGAQKCPSEAI